jgi:tRNA pseudouridine synthase 10
MVARIKNAKMDKFYKVEVEFQLPVHEPDVKTALDRLSGSLIEQRTPMRVLHRRADLVRKRSVHSARLVSLEGQYAVIEVTCSAGLYIKELISGDEGRTKPSFSELLGVQAEVKELDVLDVDVDIHVEDAVNREDVC